MAVGVVASAAPRVRPRPPRGHQSSKTPSIKYPKPSFKKWSQPWPVLAGQIGSQAGSRRGQLPWSGRLAGWAGISPRGYTYIEYARFADDLVILIDAYKRHDWLVGAVDERSGFGRSSASCR